MVFTWAIESVLLGLVSTAVVTDYLTFAQFIVACANLGLHVANAAANFDFYYSISVSYLCTVAGLLVAACLRPLTETANVIEVALLGVAVLAATGMTFASSQGSTALVFSMRAHFALLVAVLLDQVRCNTIKVWVLQPQDMCMAMALILITTQLVPFHTVAMVTGALVEAALAVFLFWTKRTAAAYVAVAVAALSLLWSVGVWVPVWFPELVMPNLSIPTITSFGLPVIKLGSISIEAGPWLITLMLVLFLLGFAGIAGWQAYAGNYFFLSVVGVPVVLVAVWVTITWVFKPTQAGADANAPSAPPMPTARQIRWPRFKAHVL
jgi:hypothetical protein